jgi:Nif-specific regulatory protein
MPSDSNKKNVHLNFDALTALYEIARVLAGAGDSLERIMTEVLDILARYAEMKRGAIFILNPDQNELALDVAHGFTEEQRTKGRYRPGEGITGKVVATGRPVAVPRLSEEPLFLDRTGARKNLSLSDLSFLCVPVRARGKVIGALSADRVAVEKYVTLEGELRFLEAVADLIAQTVLARQRESAQLAALAAENLRLRSALEDSGKISDMVGNSRAMREVTRLVAQVAEANTTVLIRGETGTGKELVARAIHQRSARRNGPFVAVNCGALPEPLLESELFGHEKGAFTGAMQQRIGYFETAKGGDIFLDEIGELSPSAQSRLLRIIQEREFQRVGGSKTIKTNVRLIAATHRNLESEVQTGRFREDLYYRINVFPIHLPPLRDRGADILMLADHFVQKYAQESGKAINRISTPAIDMLSAYHWPGNIRELENCIERAVLLSEDGVIHGHHLPPTLQMKDNIQVERKGTLSDLVGTYEKELISDALKDTYGNQARTAEILGTTKRIMQYKINLYGIEYKRFRKKPN